MDAKLGSGRGPPPTAAAKKAAKATRPEADGGAWHLGACPMAWWTARPVEVYDRIDAMPMRIDEMKSSGDQRSPD